MHALPPPEALRSMTPYMNERMRKRRCFADKDLEMVMIERERQFEMAKSRAAPVSQSPLGGFHAGMAATGACGIFPPSPMMSKPRALLGNVSPRDFLQRIFPSHNPNVLELVWQGCGGNLERAIEQLASGIKPDSPAAAAGAPASVSPGAAHASPSPAHPLLQQLQHQQHSTLQQQQQQQQQQLYLQAAAAAGMLGFAPGGVPLGAGVLAVRPQSLRDPRLSAALQGSAGPPSPHPPLPALPLPFPFLPAVRQAGFPLLPKSCGSSSVAAAVSSHDSSLPRGLHPSIQRWFDSPGKPQRCKSPEDLVRRKSAFRSFLPAGIEDGSSNTPSSDRGSVASDRSSLSPVPNTPPSSQSRASSSDELSDSERPVQTAPRKTLLKFSVESIIGNV